MQIEKEVINLKELTKYIGLSKSTIYKMTMNKEIPYYKVSKFLFFRSEEIRAWVLRNQIVSLADLNIQPLNSTNL